MYGVTSMYGFKNEKTLYADSSNIILRRNHCIWSGNLMAYPSNKPFKCFWSILFNISFGCSKDIIRFTKHILLPRYIPDFNLWIFVEWSDETLVNISSSIELWQNQPAYGTQLCIGPNWEPKTRRNLSYKNAIFLNHEMI